jgi:alcohol oxidase
MWTYKFAREIARRMPHYRGEPSMLHPAFAQGGPASVVEHTEGPVSFDAPRVVYSEEDERVLEAYVRANGTWLLSFSVFLYGTCSLVFRPFYSGAR